MLCRSSDPVLPVGIWDLIMESCNLIHLKRNGSDGSSYALMKDSTLILGKSVICHLVVVFVLFFYAHSIIQYCMFVAAEIQNVISECKFLVCVTGMPNSQWIQLER